MTREGAPARHDEDPFRNASGLPDDAAGDDGARHDHAGLRLQDDFPKHYPLFGLRTFTYNGHSHRNHNTLLLPYGAPTA